VILSNTSTGLSEHGIFHGITANTNNQAIEIKPKKWPVYNRVGVTGAGWHVQANFFMV
jgi:hypothetical protein